MPLIVFVSVIFLTGLMINPSFAGTKRIETRNLQLVSNFYGYLEAANVAGMLSLCADSVYWYVPGASNIVPYAGNWTGKAGIQQFLTVLNQNVRFGALKTGITVAGEFRGVGYVVQFVHEVDTAKPTNKTYVLDFAVKFTIGEIAGGGAQIAGIENLMDTYLIASNFCNLGC